MQELYTLNLNEFELSPLKANIEKTLALKDGKVTTTKQVIRAKTEAAAVKNFLYTGFKTRYVRIEILQTKIIKMLKNL